MRTFIAIELESAVKRPIIQLLRTFPRAEGVSWCSEPQLHITLKFLGDITDPQLGRILRIVEDASAAVAPFEFTVRGLGVFPAPANPRVLWCGVDDPGAGCRRWVEAADPFFEEINVKPETRAFTPHITLGRSKSSAGAGVLRDLLENASPPACPAMRATQVVVFESVLGPGGARYKPVATSPLGGR
jgi:2'-5' RNA ligase